MYIYLNELTLNMSYAVIWILEIISNISAIYWWDKHTDPDNVYQLCLSLTSQNRSDMVWLCQTWSDIVKLVQTRSDSVKPEKTLFKTLVMRPPKRLIPIKLRQLGQPWINFIKLLSMYRIKLNEKLSKYKIEIVKI